MREHFVPPVLEEGYRQEPCQGLRFVYCPQQPLTDSAVYFCRQGHGDDRRAARQCSPRNISFLQR